MKDFEIYGALLQRYNNKQYVFTVQNLIDDLGKRSKKSDIENVVIALLRNHIIREVSGVFEFRCDYRRFRQFLIDLDRPIAIEKTIDLEVVSKEALINTSWTLLEADEEEDFEIIGNIDNDDDDDDDLFSFVKDDDEEAEDFQIYECTKELIQKYMQNKPGYDCNRGVCMLRMNIAFPNGSPFEVRIEDDAEHCKLYITDNSSTYHYLLSLLNESGDSACTLAMALMKQLEDTSALVCRGTALCAPVNLNHTKGSDDVEYIIVGGLLRVINKYIESGITWLTDLIDDQSAKQLSIQAFINKTKQNSYDYEDEEMFKQVAIAMIERVILIHPALLREDAVEIAKTLESYWKTHGGTPATLRLIATVREEFELCSPKEFNILKTQLFTKQ